MQQCIVRYIGKSKDGLTQGNLYGVSTSDDTKLDDLHIVVWNDNGLLHKITIDEYEVVENLDWWTKMALEWERCGFRISEAFLLASKSMAFSDVKRVKENKIKQANGN